MKPRMLLALAMLLVLLMASSVPATAGGASVPFKALYSCLPRVAGVDENGCVIQQLPCEGEASHLGEGTWYSDGKACPGTWIQWGDNATWTAANGDRLFGGYLGTFGVDPEGMVHFEGTYYIDGGDGRFEGYTGTGTYEGTAIGGLGELSFEGTLTKP